MLPSIRPEKEMVRGARVRTFFYVVNILIVFAWLRNKNTALWDTYLCDLCRRGWRLNSRFGLLFGSEKGRDLSDGTRTPKACAKRCRMADFPEVDNCGGVFVSGSTHPISSSSAPGNRSTMKLAQQPL